MTPINYQQELRFSRQIAVRSVDIDGQQQLLNSHVLIIGAGGLGCPCIQYLAGSGVGHLTIVDDDRIEATNLPRQILYNDNQIDTFKAEAAVQWVQQNQPETLATAITERLSDDSLSRLMKAHDLVIDCSDNLPTREQINRLCWQTKRPLVSAAAIRTEGQIMRFNPSDGGPCYACFSRLFNDEPASCSTNGVLSAVTGIMGTMQALEGVRMLLNLAQIRYDELLIFDALSLQWHSMRVDRDDSCPVCG